MLGGAKKKKNPSHSTYDFSIFNLVDLVKEMWLEEK